jgi:asparagine synthase (glutamine-hydrolysing)
VLGHTRLAIRDTTDRASQPFQTASRKSVIAFNGEIYNADQLRSQLRCEPVRWVPSTSSDTEVLAETVERHGCHILPILEGMFAFAQARVDDSELLLARDRFGEKPLYWFRDGDGTIFFASELRPLRMLVKVQAINKDALCEYLTFGFLSGDEAILADVQSVLPGEWWKFSRDGRTANGKYWPPDTDVDRGGDPNGQIADIRECVDELEERLLAATAAVLVSDRKMCITLSGGVDSSLIACAVSRLGADVPAVTIRAASSDGRAEASTASWTARRLGLDWTQVDLNSDSLSTLDSDLRSLDEPLGDSSFIPALAVSRAIRSTDAVVAVGGDGGDEMFLGYPHYLRGRWRRPTALQSTFSVLLPLTTRIPAGQPGRGWAIREGVQSYPLMDRAQSDWHIVGGLMGREWGRASRILLQERTTSRYERLAENRVNEFDVCRFLPGDILRKSDRASMRVGLEIRSPWLHPVMADFALRVPGQIALADGLKSVPKRLLDRWLPGNPITRHPKRGFSVPLGQWIASDEGAQRISTLLQRLPPEIDAAYSTSLLRGQLAGRTNASRLFSLASLAAWYRA